ncbi:hypothetical protein KSS87_010821 [Heliosperma pusillum]|nr:hypothetical protein KSS87_010821 [Heliosperma pusillum]
MDKAEYPLGMSFVVVGPSIFMVGGYYSRHISNPFRLSNETFIYHTSSNTIAPGPTLVSPKARPLLFTLGSRIFALSRNIYCYDRKNPVMDPKPRFEVLDTDNLSHGWSPLPPPRLVVSRENHIYSIGASGAVSGNDDNSGAIFISVKDAGTYVFDVIKMVWSYVSDDLLPFSGCAVPMPPSLGFPHTDSLLCALSLKAKAYSAFHFEYYADESDTNKIVYRVDEIEIDNSPLLFPLPPPDIYHGRSLVAFGPIGRVYSILSGADTFDAINTYHGNRYVKITALDLCRARRDKKRMRRMGNDEEQSESHRLVSNVRQVLRRCDQKKAAGYEEETEEFVMRRMGHDEEQSESHRLVSNVRQVLRRCGQKKAAGYEEETEEFLMSRIWAKSFLEGPTCHVSEPISAAFAM